MKRLSYYHLKRFLNACKVEYDEYDIYSNRASLVDSEGVEIAYVDYETNTKSCEKSIYIDDETKVSVSEKQMITFLNYIDYNTQIQRTSKQQTKENDYDVSKEQDLYN